MVVELKTMVQQISRVLVQKITKNEVNKILFFKAYKTEQKKERERARQRLENWKKLDQVCPLPHSWDFRCSV